IAVKERTREIGVRVAIGTRASTIMRQFLFESIAMCLLGGAAGVALGCVAGRVLSWMSGWPVHVTTASIVTAVLCSASVGITFGLYPASRAAKLDPVDALRAG